MNAKSACFFFAFLLFLQNQAFAFSFSLKKKQVEEGAPMVHTVDEWLEEGTNIKMDLRKRPSAPEEDIQNVILPAELPKYLESYNVRAGAPELNLEKLYKEKIVRSDFVSDPNFKNAVYTETYYYPQTRQTASTFYLIKMDGNLGEKERLEDLSVFEHTRYPLISTALPYLKENFFSTLTLVDFSPSGKEILVKEKRGSHKYGIYETYVWIYFLTDEDKNSNTCYLNNIAFSNEMNSFMNLDNLSELKKSENTGSKNTKKLAENWLNEGGAAYGTEGHGGVENGFAGKGSNLTYNDISDFIKGVWSDELKTSPVKSRWYNKIPVDFTVDIPAGVKENLGFGVRLNLLNEVIKAYWFDKKQIILNLVRWDILPLGFNADNKDEIIVSAYAYRESDKEKISLGNWGVDIKTGIPRLISGEENITISANGFILREKLNPR